MIINAFDTCYSKACNILLCLYSLICTDEMLLVSITFAFLLQLFTKKIKGNSSLGLLRELLNSEVLIPLVN